MKKIQRMPAFLLAVLFLASCAAASSSASPQETSSVTQQSASSLAESVPEGQQEFEEYQKRLAEGDMENLMQMASVSDGAYSEAVFYELTVRLFADPGATLTGIVNSAYLDDMMGQTDEEKEKFLFTFGRYNVFDYSCALGGEGDNEPSRTLRAALECIGKDDERYWAASSILDGWNHPETAESSQATQ